ncbi:MAG: hypothetical protein ACJ76K_02805 [Solirubrobacteraceae bacterium]
MAPTTTAIPPMPTTMASVMPEAPPACASGTTACVPTLVYVQLIPRPNPASANTLRYAGHALVSDMPKSASAPMASAN